MSLEDVIINLQIEVQNRKKDLGNKAKEIIFKTNVVESNTIKPRFKNEKKNNKKKFKNYNPTFKKKGNCFFFFGKRRHHAGPRYKRHKKIEENPSKANWVEGEDIIGAIMLSEVNVVAKNND